MKREFFAIGLAAVVVVVGCGSKTRSPVSTDAAKAQSTTRVAPPVIDESFTLPCPAHPRTRLDFEGCIERALMRSDQQINVRAKAIFHLIRTRTTRTEFVDGEHAWLSYRRGACSTQSSFYGSGSERPNEFGRCEVRLNARHLTDLAEIESSLRPR